MRKILGKLRSKKSEDYGSYRGHHGLGRLHPTELEFDSAPPAPEPFPYEPQPSRSLDLNLPQIVNNGTPIDWSDTVSYPDFDSLEPRTPLHDAFLQQDDPLTFSSPFPLPVEIMFLIIDKYLTDDVKALLNLAKAVCDLRHHCWTQAFRSVKVYIRQRESDRKKDTSNVDLFLQLITKTPEMLPYIQEIDIRDRGRMVWQQKGLTSTSQEDLTTLSLLLVKAAHKMPNIHSFRITSSLTWPNLPIHVKEAFFALFSAPSLSEIALCGILLPVNLLGLIKNLKVVDFQTGGAGPPIFHHLTASVKPKHVDALKIRDRNPFSNPMALVGFSESSFKPFSLAHLYHLEICLPGKHLATVQEGLRVCKSLEVFKVFVGTAGGRECCEVPCL